MLPEGMCEAALGEHRLNVLWAMLRDGTTYSPLPAQAPPSADPRPLDPFLAERSRKGRDPYARAYLGMERRSGWPRGDRSI